MDTVKNVGIAFANMDRNWKIRPSCDPIVLLSHTEPSTGTPSEAQTLALGRDEVLLIGRRPSLDRLDRSTRACVEALGRPRMVQLTLPSRSCVSRVQLALWSENGQVRAAVPPATQRVFVQPWGHSARSTPLSSLPQGEPIDALSTLWLAWSDAGSGYAGGRWRVGIVAVSTRIEPDGGERMDTFEPMFDERPALDEGQLEAVLQRYGEYLNFPASSIAPSPRPYRRLPAHRRKTVEHRLESVKETVRLAYGLPRLGTDHQLLQMLLDCGALQPEHAIPRAADHDIEIAEQLSKQDRHAESQASRPSAERRR